MKVVFSGLESSGKSLRLAMVAARIVRRNAKYQKLTRKSRPIYTNMPFSESFHHWATQEMGVQVFLWKNLDDLIQLENCDVIIDEIANYFDSRGWESLPLDARIWLSQGAKRGVELYGGAQDFAQVDKAFRRLVNHLVHIKKVIGSVRPSATKPPVRYIWGVCLMVELDPQTYKEDKDKFAMKSAFSLRFFLVERRYCLAFDTNAKIERSKPPKLKHLERQCELIQCGYNSLRHL